MTLAHTGPPLKGRRCISYWCSMEMNKRMPGHLRQVNSKETAVNRSGVRHPWKRMKMDQGQEPGWLVKQKCQTHIKLVFYFKHSNT